MVNSPDNLLLTSTPPRLKRLRTWGQTWLPNRLRAPLRTVARPLTAVTTPTNSVSWQPQAAAAAAHSDVLTVLSTNLWHDWPRFRQLERRLEALARLVEREQVDILLLQETARTKAFKSDEWFARRLNMAFVYARANGHAESIGFEEGLTILSRFPMRQPRLRALDPDGSLIVQRLALGATIRTPLADLPVFTTHLSLRRWRNAAQLQQLQQWVQETTPGLPALIGGDFNVGETAGQMTAVGQQWVDTFRSLHPEKDGATHSLNWPWGKPLKRQRLDYLFLKPGPLSWQIIEASHIHTPGIAHSDHQAVLVRLNSQ